MNDVWDWKPWAAPAMCLAAGVLAFMLLQGAPDDAEEGALPQGEQMNMETRARAVERDEEAGGEGGEDAQDDAPASPFDAQSLGLVEDLLGEGAARKSSSEAFLNDLAHGVEEPQSEGALALVWEERASLPDAAALALRRYQKQGDAALALAGYLDLKGNAWAALLRVDGGWVDVLTATTVDDETSEIRVVRLDAERGVG